MNYTEFTGKTVEEAIETGLSELGISKDQADIRILEEGKKKLFGAVKARVEIAVKEVEEKKLSDGERTVVFLEGLFKLLDINAQTELVSEGDKVEIVVDKSSNGAIKNNAELRWLAYVNTDFAKKNLIKEFSKYIKY